MLPSTSVPVVAPPGHVGRIRPWRNVGIFLAALAGMHLLLDAWLPLPNVGEVSEKLSYYSRHKGDFDAVFVGSSRISAQVAPALFDQEITAATGRPMRSFNLGAPSMFLPESLYVIDRILAQRSTRLRWMFIELDDPRPRLEEHAGLVRREVYWHTWSETVLLTMRILTTSGFHKADRVSMLMHQWTLFGRRWSHLGRALEWFTTGAGNEDSTALGPAMDGYKPYKTTLGETKDTREDVENFLAATAALKLNHGSAGTAPSVPVLLRWMLAGKIRALHAQNVEPVFIIAPETTSQEEFSRLAHDGGVQPLFAFNDPVAYPELYEVNVRADTAHLNAAGAQRFTRLLAARFAKILIVAPSH